MNKEEIKRYLERTDDLGTRLTGEDKETFTWVVYGYNQCAKLLKEMEQKAEEQQKDYLEALRIKHERAYEITKMKEQQKKFMSWLEDLIKQINPKELDIGELNLRLDDIKFTHYLIYKEILQKYKEIIGADK